MRSLWSFNFSNQGRANFLLSYLYLTLSLSFDKAIWKRLVVSRSQKSGPFSFAAPHSFYDHKCGLPNEPEGHVCVDGFCSIKGQYNNIPAHTHHDPPTTCPEHRHHWLKKVEKENVEKIKAQDDLDPEDVYRSLAGLHSLRNAERIIAG